MRESRFAGAVMDDFGAVRLGGRRRIVFCTVAIPFSLPRLASTWPYSSQEARMQHLSSFIQRESHVL